jgi:hypothetical protein
VTALSFDRVREGEALPTLSIAVTPSVMTTNGYVQRFVNDWAAPAGRIRSVQLRLGVPNFAGDTLRLTGIVRAKDAAARIVEVAVTGANRLGEHVAATVRVALP